MDMLVKIKELARNGRRAEAKVLCQKVVAQEPTSEAALLELLRLDPTPLEEIAALEALLTAFPEHRFAKRFSERLDEMRVVALLNEIPPTNEKGTESLNELEVEGNQRLGEFLMSQGLISAEQLATAIAEQRRRQILGEPQRLGALLLLQNAITVEQLALALTQQMRSGSLLLGDFLVRRGAITSAQLQQALEQQVQAALEIERHYAQSVAGTTKNRGGSDSVPPAHGESLPRLRELLVELNFLSQEQLQLLLAERQRLFYTSLT